MNPLLARKEIGATLLFVVAGCVGLIIAPSVDSVTLATAIFYAGLLINTFFSIQFFAALPPKDRDERAVDGALVLSYLALGLTIGRPVPFIAASVALFLFAVLKYILLMPVVARHDILHRKLVIDWGGLLLCTICLAGAVAGYPLISVWVHAIVFNLFNAYLLLVRPMYVT